MAVCDEHLQIPGTVHQNPEFYVQLGRRIAGLRRAVGWSQEKLGEAARVGSSYIAHIEIGNRKPTIDVLLRLADALDVPLWRLLTDDRLTPDEKAWDAASRDLAERVHGLAQPDLQALSYLATRLKTADAPAKGARVVRPLAVHTSSESTPTTLRAAESRALRYQSHGRRRKIKPGR